MFNLLQPIVYFSLIFLCLLIAFLKRESDNSKLVVYFLLVAIIEVVSHFLNVETNFVYTFGTFAYIIYFIFYYSKQLPRIKNFIIALGIICCAVSVYLIVDAHEIFPVGLGICIAVLYIILSLSWLFNESQNADSVFIAQKQAFWVSVALLFWSIIFLFKVTPMYWLAQNDVEFLMILHKIFKIAVVITYALFLVAVTRKY